MADNAIAQVVDLELRERSSQEIACAYRALCAAVLLRTAMAAKSRPRPRKIELEQKRTAAIWAESGDQGVLSFDQCCEAVGYDPESTRKAIMRYASAAGQAPINNSSEKRQARSRMVFGRKAYVRTGTSSPLHGVASRPANAAAHCSSEAGSRKGDRNHPAA